MKLQDQNDITRIFNTRYPLIQAPMVGVTTPKMVSAANRANVLGSLPLGDLPADKCRELIQASKQLTDKPFAVNIFVHPIPEITDDLKNRYRSAKDFIEQLALQHGLDVMLPDIDDIVLTDYHEQVDAIISENCKIVSFTFGNLDIQSIEKLKRNDTVLIGTCTSIEEAEILEESGIDLLCVQGIEAGGHRGSFIGNHIPEIGALSLLSKISDKVRKPLIYAGGICNAKTLLAAKTLGAQGFQIGSLLMGAKESALQEFEKARLRSATESQIILTKSFSGRYARGIRNLFIEEVEKAGHILPFPYQNKLTFELRRAAKTAKNTDFISLWMGQSIHSFPDLSTTDIMMNLINEVENQL